MNGTMTLRDAEPVLPTGPPHLEPVDLVKRFGPLAAVDRISLSVADNPALRIFDRAPQSKGPWLLSRSALRRRAREFIQQFNIRTPSPETPARHLSGGNVQRMVLARELPSGAPRLLMAANPCFGLDFSAVEFIHGRLIEARNRGVAVLLVSEGLDELLSLADRIVVMAGGAFVYETPAANAEINLIGQKMAGHS